MPSAARRAIAAATLAAALLAGTASAATAAADPVGNHACSPRDGVRLELQVLGRDAPYARPSNGVFSVAIASLSLTLPTLERRPR